MPFEDVLEVRREGEVDVEEVRHVDHVVDDLAAVGALDQQRVPGPLGPAAVVAVLGVALGVGVGPLDVGDGDLRGRWVALVVVPDEQLAVALERRPLAGAGQRRHAPRVRDRGALAVDAGPAPVVERAGDVVTLDLAHAQVATHVPAVGIEHPQFARAVGPDDQLRAEDFDRVRLAVPERLGQAEAVPAARISRGRGTHIELPDLRTALGRICHRDSSSFCTRTRYKNVAFHASDSAHFLHGRVRVPAMNRTSRHK
ncbi:Uncharacterised protein [Mycobacteroides abscessus subsp. abscessus]|nr:Uncharacterised protein [Mycobacteroides abscessus subsp. abscessus]